MNVKLKLASMLIAYRYAKKQTQTKVSKKLNVSFQQVQKYERMQNGLSSEKLFTFCEAYNIPVGDFQTKDPWTILDGADIDIIQKEKALQKIDNLERIANDQSRSEKNMVGQSISPISHI